MRKVLFLLLGAIFVLGMVGIPHPHTTRAQEDATYPCAATHYPNFGECEAAPDDELKVAYGVYNNRETDPIAVDSTMVAALATILEADTGLHFTFLNDWAEVQAGSENIQIVNNVPIEGALYTMVLPIGWTPEATYPLVLSGNGAGTSNNNRLYVGQETLVIEMIARSTADGKSGFVAALSNAGGTESQGIDDVTYQSVGAFFAWAQENAGGDPARFVTAGASRGGGTALMWGMNPLGLDYNVKAIFADIPPLRYGSLTQGSLMTYPALGGINVLVLHNPFGWIYGRTNGPGEPYALAMEYLIGTGDPAEADALSPMGKIDLLQGKDLLIAASTHDAFFQLGYFIEFDNKLNELGIPHGSFVTLGQGHALTVPLWAEFERYMAGLMTNEPYALPTTRTLWIDPTPGGKSLNDVPLNEFLTNMGMEPLEDGVLPLTVEFPFKTAANLPMDVSACGAPGADFAVMWTAPGATEATPVLEGTFDETECMKVQFVTPEVAGDYTWSFMYRGEVVNAYPPKRDEAGCLLAPVTTVLEQQPFLADHFAIDASLGWGVDQFAGQAEACMVE